MARHRYETAPNTAPACATAATAARNGFGRTHGSAERGRSWAAKRAEDALIVLAGIGLALPLIVLGA